MNFPVSSTLSFNRTSWPSLPCFSGIGRCRCRFSAIKVSTISFHATSGGDFGGRSQYNRKNKLNGVIFKYGRKPIQVAFKTGDHKQQVIFIAGLSDGFLATPYLEPLAAALDKEKWSLVQFLLSSSYSGYGMSSLKQDALELDQLIKHLIKEEYSNGVVLLGHSTGCQDIVYYLRSNALYSKSVRAAILQAPVSDREYNAVNPETGSMLDLASKMISEGKGLELMPRNAIRRVPVTAYRYHSLYAYNGDDDLFSSDLTEEQLTQKLGHMSNTPCQVIFSMADEYVPEYVDKKSLVDRLCRGMGDAEKVEIENGNHALSNHVEEAVRAIVGFLSKERDS